MPTIGQAPSLYAVALRYANLSLLTLIGLLWALSEPASGQDDTPRIASIAGSVSLATDYVFRGISQTQEEPQVQVDLSWSHPDGWYSGVWASNTEFGGPGNSMEIDPYVGYAGSIDDTDFSYDLGYWHYHFPGARSDFDYGEFYTSVGYGPEHYQLSFSAFYADDYFGGDFFGTGSSLAYHGELSHRLVNEFIISARLGRQTFDAPASLGNQDYHYYDIGLSRPWLGFTLGLRWHDTDGVDAGLAPARLADGRLVFRLSRDF